MFDMPLCGFWVVLESMERKLSFLNPEFWL